MECYPDKLADHISCVVVSTMLSDDLEWRIALGIMVKTAMAFVDFEVRISTYVDLEEMI